MPDDKMGLEECVRAFLDVALVHPDKEPKTQRAQMQNQCIIVGFNRAQEALRTILKEQGRTKRIKEIAEVRNDNQQKPMKVGNLNIWGVS